MQNILLEEINRVRKLMNLNEVSLLSESPLDDVINAYVGEDKPISEELFNEIKDVSNNATQFIIWLIKKIVNKLILSEDVYKYKKYFNLFNKYKSSYSKKDINQIKTSEDIQEFIDKSMEIDDKLNSTDVSITDKDKYITINEIKKLEDNGIKYLGVEDGYQVFEVPNEIKDNQEAWKTYKTILGKCKGRETGEGIEICTIASFDHFRGYLSKYPGSSYFVMYNLSDPNSPYQLHFESRQFMDKNDKSLLNGY